MSSKKIKVVLVGQPNVGKSHLVNAITGATLHVGNFAGVTVDKKEIEYERAGYEITILDLPGIYSLNSYSPEEDVTKEYLLDGEYDIIVNVVDANALQRNLLLTIDLLHMSKQTVLAVNMIDEIESRGDSIDAKTLSELLGIPVVLVSAKHKKGIEELNSVIIERFESGKHSDKIYYDQKIEDEIEKLEKIIQKEPLFKKDSRFVIIRLLEGDKDIYKKLHDNPIFLQLQQDYRDSSRNLTVEFNEDDAPSVLLNHKVALAKGIASKTVHIKHKESLTEKIDKVLIHQIFGLPIFLFFMWALFQFTFTVGHIPAEAIQAGFDWTAALLKAVLADNDLTKALTDGAIPAVGSIMVFLPNILILFLGINLLEQTGYMARAAFLLDGVMKIFGLHGKAFIPLVSGFGCSVPAYMAARTLKNPIDRLLTLLVIGFFSCSARLPVYVLFIGAFFPRQDAGNILFIIYIAGAILGMVAAKVLRSLLFKGEAEPFVMEMPKYRMPTLRALFRELKIKAVMFIKRAGKFIAPIAMLVWFLSNYPTNTILQHSYETKIEAAKSGEEKKSLELELGTAKLENSYMGSFGKAIEPVFMPLGFDWRMSVATVSALAAKEVAVSTLATLYSVESSEEDASKGFLVEKIQKNIDIKAAIAFIIIIMTYSPCIAAMSTFFTEMPKWKWRAFYLIYPNALAWVLGFTAFTVLSWLNF